MPTRKKPLSKQSGNKDSSAKVQVKDRKKRDPVESNPPEASFPIVGIGASAGAKYPSMPAGWKPARGTRP